LEVARARSGWNPHLANGLSLPPTAARFQAAIPGRSRPAASMRCRIFVRTVRSTAPSLSPVSPGSGEIATANPFPNSNSAISIGPRISTPLRGFRTPPDQSFNPATDQVAHLPNAPDCPSLPAAYSIGIVSAADQRSRPASLPFGSLFLDACCAASLAGALHAIFTRAPGLPPTGKTYPTPRNSILPSTFLLVLLDQRCRVSDAGQTSPTQSVGS
jgi:hypothetical protein